MPPFAEGKHRMVEAATSEGELTGSYLTTRSSPATFAPGVSEKIGFYVYLLIDPRDESVFYVGKGTGNRCFAHLEEARRMLADTVAGYEKLARIREIESTGAAVKIHILRHGLSESVAFHVESAAIDQSFQPSLGTGDR
jgi:hypothetical protein